MSLAYDKSLENANFIGFGKTLMAVGDAVDKSGHLARGSVL